jgi:hypothetical protein
MEDSKICNTCGNVNVSFWCGRCGSIRAGGNMVAPDYYHKFKKLINAVKEDHAGWLEYTKKCIKTLIS